MKIIDARGLSCPQPVILTKRELEKNGNKATVLVDNDIAVDNIKRFAESRDLSVTVTEESDDFKLVIE